MYDPLKINADILPFTGRDGPASAGGASRSVLTPGRPRAPRRGAPTSKFRCVFPGAIATSPELRIDTPGFGIPNLSQVVIHSRPEPIARHVPPSPARHRFSRPARKRRRALPARNGPAGGLDATLLLSRIDFA